MPFAIDNEVCNACGSCEEVCPNNAISHKGKVFTINAAKCKECVGDFDVAQCADVCPSGACALIAA
ncbi:4Fe-4S dicluster domain-containing protein [Rhodovastum atsumiense]|uniref:4Fe-4S dicluster domain-containing protein n=1 Tax=Rhodovastum atsumiense TaxID=504468 RepID=A0A5M6IV61_9PROT|nr:4Fe-4S binding protein [Rhodovastum atsumiense]KAA5612196.1 4Fe-4S dicluster domain-containing protein [Rhodovastum atsumiense]CAH2603847.1 4Fe-4S dicluster domain-containing protein [Rhodovastum atsumiense]